ncbi:TRAF family member-associated NF-kappa-B activator [Galemys pyrenaicus]|uniref:TRAF family member-associated NF-kappa-B activator n=1 Tax=Galemys pyrenaicus TaxID=202257 RepID=A0A8J6DHF4_GALPY|nr:TRAF family member-associated NF-kappa-B activator [Galemys pyrenaicus]
MYPLQDPSGAPFPSLDSPGKAIRGPQLPLWKPFPNQDSDLPALNGTDSELHIPRVCQWSGQSPEPPGAIRAADARSGQRRRPLFSPGSEHRQDTLKNEPRPLYSSRSSMNPEMPPSSPLAAAPALGFPAAPSAVSRPSADSPPPRRRRAAPDPRAGERLLPNRPPRPSSYSHPISSASKTSPLPDAAAATASTAAAAVRPRRKLTRTPRRAMAMNSPDLGRTQPCSQTQPRRWRAQRRSRPAHCYLSCPHRLSSSSLPLPLGKPGWEAYRDQGSKCDGPGELVPVWRNNRITVRHISGIWHGRYGRTEHTLACALIRCKNQPQGYVTFGRNFLARTMSELLVSLKTHLTYGLLPPQCGRSC